MSTFEVPIIAIKKEPHPNADTLSLVRVYGWQVVVKTAEWTDGQLAAYIRPDSIVPDTTEWSFLEGKRRIKTRRFRGEWSHGLLHPAPPGVRVGDNVADALGITNYVAPESGPAYTVGRRSPWYKRVWQTIKASGCRPAGSYGHYDVEHLRRYPDLIPPDAHVIVTEKLHGTNALYVCKRTWYGRKKLYMRSRTVWRWPFMTHWWSQALTPEMKFFLYEWPNYRLYGEIVGTQDLAYGVTKPTFVMFDIMSPNGTYLHKSESQTIADMYYIPFVPVMYEGPWRSYESQLNLDMWHPSKFAQSNGLDQIMEGVVITVDQPRTQLKLINDAYLEWVRD